MLVPLEPLMDVALDPVVDVPLEPITGALGATGALLGAVPPLKVLRGLANGVTARRCRGFGRTNARQTLPDEPASLLACITFQRRLALACFLQRIRAFCFGSRRRFACHTERRGAYPKSKCKNECLRHAETPLSHARRPNQSSRDLNARRERPRWGLA